MSAAELIACHDCDLLHRRVPLPERGRASCMRCGATLYRSAKGGFDRPLAFALASLVLLVLANAFPFMTFEMSGLLEINHLASGVVELWDQGYWELAGLVLLATVLAPAIRLATLVYVCGSLQLGLRPPGLKQALKLADRLHEWAMLDVFLLGAIVAVIKLSDLADVHLDEGLWAFAGLIITLSMANAAFDPHHAWDTLEPPR
ncbi:MAG TPA: paraquat-inducible protein A [Planctomycetota bacterium]|nr:paraquat-inducible protein A [Planctomycetota bacterium]